jgi:hypothetical protein
VAESTLSLTYGELRSRISHFMGLRRSFSEGTITSVAHADGSQVALAGHAGKEFPSWAASGQMFIAGTRYTVKTRTNGTNLLLDNVSLTAAGGTSYELVEWVDAEEEDVEQALTAGLRRAYYPIVEGKMYQWEFLRVSATVAVSASTAEYALPDAFSGILEDSVAWDTTTSGKLAKITRGEYNALNTDTTEGVPKYYAIWPDSYTATTGQRWKIGLHPIPNAGTDLAYRYVVAAETISEANKFPYGGLLYSQMIVEACLAEAEKDMDDVSGIHEQLFQQHLKAALAADMESATRSKEQLYPITEPTYGTFGWLQQEIGRYLKFNAASATWTHSQTQRITHLIKSGLRQFYSPPSVPNEHAPHEWGFLHPAATFVVWGDTTYTVTGDPDGGTTITLANTPTLYSTMAGKTVTFTTSGNSYTITSSGINDTTDVITVTTTIAGEASDDTITVVSDGDYQLDADHGGFHQEAYFAAADNALYPVSFTNPSEILMSRQRNVTTSSPSGYPTRAAERPDTSDNTAVHRRILMVCPTPDGIYTLHYIKMLIEGDIASATNYPLGGEQHSETVLASCLAVAELQEESRAGGQREDFFRRLQASVALDRKSYSPVNFGYNGDNSDVPDFRGGRRFLNPATYEGTLYNG